MKPNKIVGVAIIGLALAAVLAAAGASLQSLFVVGVLLMCPLLMVGMHSGHGEDHGDHATRRR